MCVLFKDVTAHGPVTSRINLPPPKLPSHDAWAAAGTTWPLLFDSRTMDVRLTLGLSTFSQAGALVDPAWVTPSRNEVLERMLCWFRTTRGPLCGQALLKTTNYASIVVELETPIEPGRNNTDRQSPCNQAQSSQHGAGGHCEREGGFVIGSKVHMR